MNLHRLFDYVNDTIDYLRPEAFRYFSQDECEKLAGMIHNYAVTYEKLKAPIVFLMIGTNRVTFDSLAPMVVSRLMEASGENHLVFGTMERPVHALNLNHTLDQINNLYPNAYVIAIDASLGYIKDIGKVTFSPMPLQPGIGVGKNLPETGDVSICGVVESPSKFSFPEYGCHVTFHYNRHEDNAFVKRTLPAIDFIKLLIQHIPEKNFKMTRYYGLYSRHREKDKSLWKAVPKSRHHLMKTFTKWRQYILLSFGYDPLKCSQCNHEMQFVELYYSHHRVSLNELYERTMAKVKCRSA